MSWLVKLFEKKPIKQLSEGEKHNVKPDKDNDETTKT